MAREETLARTLLEAGLVLAGELDLGVLLQRIVDLACELTGARYGALGVLGSDGTITDFITVGVSESERAAIGDIPRGEGVLGVLIRDPRPLRLDDVASHPRSSGFPPNHPPMRSFLGAPVTARGRVFGNIYLTEKQDAPAFDDTDEATLVGLAAQAGVAIENARLYDEAREREALLEATYEVATGVLAGEDPSKVLDGVAAAARALVGAELSFLATPHDEGVLAVTHADGELAASILGAELPIDASLSGRVVRTGEAAVLDDISAYDLAYRPAIPSGMGPVVVVPLSAGDAAFGTLGVMNRLGGRRFGERDVRLVLTFARQAAFALEYARAQSELQRMVVLEDRERIGMELHDGVIQSLFAVGMGLQATAVMTDDGSLRARLERSVDELDRVIRDLRNYIFQLRPGMLSRGRLDEALRGLCREFEDRTGVTTIADVDPTAASRAGDAAPAILQIVREALSNVGRHAGAQTCRVTLRRAGDGLLLEVADDGAGFDPSQVRGGQGLGNLAARADELGGMMALETAAGEGTTIRINLP